MSAFRLVTQPSYTPANGVSETMKNIRWLLNKHMKNIDFSKQGMEAKPAKDVMFCQPLTVDKIITIRTKLTQGMTPRAIGKEMGLSEMVCFNIKHKKKRYKDLPDDEQSIRKWHAAKSKLKPGVKQA